MAGLVRWEHSQRKIKQTWVEGGGEFLASQVSQEAVNFNFSRALLQISPVEDIGPFEHSVFISCLFKRWVTHK